MVTEGKPDKPTLNEILASIRRITAEESAPDSAPLRLDAVHAPFNQPKEQSGEPEDFELPAMFRQDRPPTAQQTSNLISRLSNALGTSDASGTEPDPPGLGARGLDSAPRHAWHASTTPVGQPSLPLLPPPLPVEVKAGEPQTREIPREMPSCLDRMVVRMSQSKAAAPATSPRLTVSGAVASSPPVQDAPMPAGSMAAAPTPIPENDAVPKATLGFNYLFGAGSLPEFDDPEPADGPDIPAAIGLARGSPGPSGAASNNQGALPNSAEGADLLRPLLRQWLDDNITRVLTQALADTVRGNDQGS